MRRHRARPPHRQRQLRPPGRAPLRCQGKLAVTLTPEGSSLLIPATLSVDRVIGDRIPTSAEEGIRLNVNNLINFNKTVDDGLTFSSRRSDGSSSLQFPGTVLDRRPTSRRQSRRVGSLRGMKASGSTLRASPSTRPSTAVSPSSSPTEGKAVAQCRHESPYMETLAELEEER
jgi:hypothetical protein